MVYAIQNIIEAEKFIMRNYHRRDTMLKRKIEQSLNDWKNTKNHKPLIIKGCRQCKDIYIWLFYCAHCDGRKGGDCQVQNFSNYNEISKRILCKMQYASCTKKIELSENI